MNKLLKRLQSNNFEPEGRGSGGQDEALDAYKDELESRWQVVVIKQFQNESSL